MKWLSTAILAYRCFSSKTTTKNFTKWPPYKKKNKNRLNDPRNPRSPRIKWTEEQSQVLAAISSGKSVFLTGSAGTGKTILLRQAIKELIKRHGNSGVFKTGSTGVAACALEGQTVHSFSGIGLAEADLETLLSMVLRDKRTVKRWIRARALVIDEISMLSAKVFDCLEYVARMVRAEEHDCDDVVWGGLQLIVSGDFFQLPPIIDRKNGKSVKEFAFEADCWNSSFDVQVELKKIFRQPEANFVRLLQSIRIGEADPKDLKLLEKCCSEKEPDSSAVQLFPLNRDVNRVNEKKMKSLNGDIFVYRALDTGLDKWKRQLNLGIAPDELMLTEGARVMLCKNLKPWQKLVNGSTGTVTGFSYEENEVFSDICDEGLVPIVKFDSGLTLMVKPEIWVVMEADKVVATRKQLPLILAWALSIHKCQGMTIDRLHTNLSGAFGFGMVYVALSRVRSLDGLHLSGFDPSKIKAHPKVLEFYKRCAGKKDDKQGHDDGLHKDESSITHVSETVLHRESNTNPSRILHCKPNSSLVSWFNSITKRKLR